MEISASCQTPSFIDSTYYAELFNNSVAAPSEFRSRFNCETFNPRVDSSDQNSRWSNVFTLFNEEMFKTFDPGTDPEFSKAVDFVTLVADNKYQLDVADTNYFVVAHCSARYKGKAHDLDLWFAINNTKYGFPIWTMLKADAGFLRLTAADTVTQMYISSTAQDIDFMGLPNIVKNNAANIVNFASPSSGVDQLTVFLTLAASGQISIESVNRISLVFCQIPGYIFQVSRFVRDSLNSGWLIHKIDEVSDTQKQNFINDIYYKKQ